MTRPKFTPPDYSHLTDAEKAIVEKVVAGGGQWPSITSGFGFIPYIKAYKKAYEEWYAQTDEGKHEAFIRLCKQQAYPSVYDQSHESGDVYNEGITLLDYYAAKAIVSFTNYEYIEDVAKDAYKLALAMLRERQRVFEELAKPIEHE